MPMTATVNIRGRNALAACGKCGNATRSRPYAPVFRSSPARMTLPAVGASVWASGSQV